MLVVYRIWNTYFGSMSFQLIIVHLIAVSSTPIFLTVPLIVLGDKSSHPYIIPDHVHLT